MGLLYRYGYFSQMITTRGEQQAIYEFQHFSKLPLKPVRDDHGNFITLTIVFPRAGLFMPVSGSSALAGSNYTCWIPILTPISRRTGALRTHFMAGITKTV